MLNRTTLENPKKLAEYLVSKAAALNTEAKSVSTGTTSNDSKWELKQSGVTHITSCPLNHSSITSIDWSQNLIVEIPDLDSFVNLKELVASNNRISSLPSLSSCAKLRNVELAGNHLTDCREVNNIHTN